MFENGERVRLVDGGSEVEASVVSYVRPHLKVRGPQLFRLRDVVEVTGDRAAGVAGSVVWVLADTALLAVSES
jgi:hypothetical protein